MEEIAFAPETFDLIWAEGSAYIMGFSSAVAAWRPLLKRGGCLAVTELVWLTEDKPIEAEEFFGREYPAMTSRDDVIKTVVMTYENRTDGEALSRYNALLHTQYFFGLAPGDIDPGEPSILTRAQDIESTEFLFDSAMTAVLERWFLLGICVLAGSLRGPDSLGARMSFLSERQP